MFQILKVAFYSTRAMRSAAEGAPHEAENWLEKIEKIRPLKPYEEAFRSGLYLLLHDFDQAEKGFVKVVSETSNKSTVNDLYTHYYAKARLAALTGNTDLMVEFERKARCISCDKMIMGWIPL
jgi:tetratricopeptide (TPR) repeat protein